MEELAQGVECSACGILFYPHPPESHGATKQFFSKGLLISQINNRMLDLRDRIKIKVLGLHAANTVDRSPL